MTRPYGSAAALAPPTSAKTTFVADVAGTYVALLTVSDGASTSAPATTAIQAGPWSGRAVARGERWQAL